MAKNTTAFMLKEDVVTRTTFVNADGTTIKDITPASVDGTYVYEIEITSDDTAAKDVTLYLNDGTNDIPIKLATVAINQGSIIATPDPLRLIQPSSGFIVGRLLDRDQNYYIPIPVGDKLRMKCNVAVTATKTIVVNVKAKNF
jgi:hypothetical protein